MRRWLFAGSCFWLIPVLSVGAHGFGLPPVFAALAGVVGAAVLAWAAARRVAAALHTPDRLPRVYYGALLLAAVIAIVRIASLSVYIADVRHSEYSVQPEDDFRRPHSCVSAYSESARLLAEGVSDIYDREHYRSGGAQRMIGPLRVDPYHYPPTFLLLPQALRLAAPTFWDFRRVWFALQALVLAGAIFGIAAWIGGRTGTIALLAGVVVLALPQAAATFQQGNFQITAVPLAVVAFVLLMAGRPALGGGVLAWAALAKIFPGILVVPLLTARRWRPVAWVAAMGVLLLTASLWIQGADVFRTFIHTSLPEISSGAAFPQTEWATTSRVNWSAYGQTVRARQLGAEWLTQRRGLMIAELYGLAIAIFAAWAGWGARFDLATAHGRLATAQVAVALVSLASFRSPFVGAAYGIIATLWLMGLLAARSPRRSVQWIAAILLLGLVIAILPSPGYPPSTMWLVASGLLVFACMAINAWAVVLFARPSVQRDVKSAVPDEEEMAARTGQSDGWNVRLRATMRAFRGNWAPAHGGVR